MKNKVLKFIPYIIIAVFSAILINNMFYGFSWTDEGLYLSNVDRILKGDKLLIDDWTPTQFYAPLLYPFYSLFVKITDSSDGSILFFRLLTIFFQLFAGLFTYFVLSKKYSMFSAFSASLLLILFARACLNGPSYYTLAFVTYFLALICIYSVYVLSFNSIFLLLSGIFFSFSILCNPFLVIPYIALSILVLFFKKGRTNIKYISLIWAGSILSGIVYLCFILKGNSIPDILTGLSSTYNDPSYKHEIILTIKRLYKMPRLLIFPYVLTWLPMILAVTIIKLKKIKLQNKTLISLHILNILLLMINSCMKEDCGSGIMAFFHFTLFSIFLFSKLSFKELFFQFKNEILFFIVPGMILAYFFCFASDTGFGVCAIGMAVAACGEILIYSRLTSQISFSVKSILSKALKLLPLILLILTTLYYRTNFIYRDGKLPLHLLFIPSIHNNIERIEAGPAKGIYTTRTNKKSYDDLYALLKNINNDKNQSIFISGTATWAYMAFSNLKCSAPTTWRTFCDDMRLKP
nr:hypothetical protein [Treponemataceae bacterium]